MVRAAAALLCGCAAAGPAQEEAAPPGPAEVRARAELAAAPGPGVPASSAEVPAEVRAVVPAWRRVDPAWFAAATVWMVAGFETGTYPCVQVGDSLDMIESQAFAPRQVLRGTVAARAIDVRAYDLKGPSYPRTLAQDRTYLVLLRPTPASRATIEDPQGIFHMHTALGPEEVVAVVDLSQTAVEARAEATQAHRSATQGGFTFTPAVWAAARAAATVTAEQHAPVARFVADTLLRAPGTPLAEARAWLGEPDDESRWGDGKHLVYRYYLGANHRSATAGSVYGHVKLSFRDGVLVRGEVVFLRWFVEPTFTASREIPAAELQALGLAAYRLGPSEG